eukprot:gnl/Spiro4/18839_TR10065_c0_g1_i1.p1 gnl/Spiro4/18839_TR10065_c0_g1~~gnl/Spiro4/18839_TR10065_c0_g1_i1.p1  ORF type:complete len:417 (-),score=57.15 gnl/Spiro4/18839_TR10065_c0_g1_i1:66-1316(-)
MNRASTALRRGGKKAPPAPRKRVLVPAIKNPLALLDAAANGEQEWVLRFAAQGYPFNVRDQVGTPLLHAAANGQLLMVQFLLEQGFSSIEETTRLGSTALLVAAGFGHPEIVKYLLSHGVSYESVNKDGYDALMYAAAGGHTSTVKWLVEAGGFSVLRRGNDGGTPLLAAALNGHYDCVLFLLDNGASVLEKNKREHNAIAMAGKHPEVQRLLISRRDHRPISEVILPSEMPRKRRRSKKTRTSPFLQPTTKTKRPKPFTTTSTSSFSTLRDSTQKTRKKQSSATKTTTAASSASTSTKKRSRPATAASRSSTTSFKTTKSSGLVDISSRIARNQLSTLASTAVVEPVSAAQHSSKNTTTTTTIKKKKKVSSKKKKKQGDALSSGTGSGVAPTPLVALAGRPLTGSGIRPALQSKR